MRVIRGGGGLTSVRIFRYFMSLGFFWRFCRCFLICPVLFCCVFVFACFSEVGWLVGGGYALLRRRAARECLLCFVPMLLFATFSTFLRITVSALDKPSSASTGSSSCVSMAVVFSSSPSSWLPLSVVAAPSLTTSSMSLT